MVADNRVWFGANDDGRPAIKRFLSEVKQGRVAQTFWPYTEVGHNQDAKKELLSRVAFKSSDVVFSTPKPTKLVRRMLQLATAPNTEDIVLDFFAGSGTTADAVIQQNAQDGGNRRFILVQLAEPVEENSSAFSTISSFSRERVRRAGQKVLEESGLAAGRLDTGFRAIKVDTTNMADVLRSPDETDQLSLSELEGSVKPGRSGEDLLFQVLLDWGLELTMDITVEQIDGREVFTVEDGALIACFDDQVSPELVRTIATRQPLRAVFCDSSFASDDARLNAEQVFREVSPATDVKAI